MQTHPWALATALTIPLFLAACGDDAQESAETTEEQAAQAQEDTQTSEDASAEAQTEAEDTAAWDVPTVQSDGVAVCLDLVTEQLGTDIRVHEIASFFAAGPDLEDSISLDEPPAKGELTSCDIQFQDPDDENALLQQSLDMETGEFAGPQPMEIRYSGDAAEFDLDDYVMDLSEVDASGIDDLVAQEEPAVDEVLSDFAWDGFWLSPPGPGSEVHELRLDVMGLLESNGLEVSGSLYLTPQGEVTLNNLTNF